MEFCTSSETKRRRSPVTGKPEYHFSPTKRISRLAGSYVSLTPCLIVSFRPCAVNGRVLFDVQSLIVLMVFIVMSIVFSIFILRHNFNESKNKFLKVSISTIMLYL